MDIKYALVEGKRREPERGLLAKCPICENRMIAKCGKIRVKHWAHFTKRTCDLWWEYKTEWHLAWQEKFPSEWREFPQNDPQSGEKHIADVRTSHGLVIEFQHSHLDPQERGARERFYKNMIWVVNGTRVKGDCPRFLKGVNGFKRTNKLGHYLVSNPEKCFPSAWLDSPVSVIFDFLGVTPVNPPDEIRDHLWCLLPHRVEGNAVVVALSRSRFVDDVSKPPQIPQAPAQQTIGRELQQNRSIVLPANIPREMVRMINKMPFGRSFRF